MQLSEQVNGHVFWSNPIFISIKNNTLSYHDYQFIFSQYYYYSRSFTRFLSALLTKPMKKEARNIIMENMVEEAGAEPTEKAHSVIFEEFLLNGLDLKIEEIKQDPITELFVIKMLNLILEGTFEEGVAILAYSIEGIVHRMYSIFMDGLSALNLSEDSLHFFKLHLDCDDGHAEHLESILLEYKKEYDNNVDVYANAVSLSLDLRNAYFCSLFQQLKYVRSANFSSKFNFAEDQAAIRYAQNNINLAKLSSLYDNKVKKENIGFKVSRFEVEGESLDPRMLSIFPGQSTEKHSHAHESFFYVISGHGEIEIENKTIIIKAGQATFVPRWLYHRTINKSEKINLEIIAITDFKLTHKFLGNSEHSYRLKNFDIATKSEIAL